MPDAFKHQDSLTVPLVWQHGHSEPTNVLGHAVLENRSDGVYCHGFFNGTTQGQNAKQLVEHKDIQFLSIYANQLVEKSKQVFHGMIREVSLVLAGANPGAKIDNVSIAHGDGEFEVLDDAAVITSGEELQHADYPGQDADKGDPSPAGDALDEEINEDPDEIYEDNDGDPDKASGGKGGTDDDKVGHSASDENPSIQDVYDTLNEDQQQLLHYMVGAAIQQAADENDNQAQHSDTEGSGDMTRRNNVFEGNTAGGDTSASALSHDDMQSIFTAAAKGGSLKGALEDYALSHGIESIDTLFPYAQDVLGSPEWLSRRTEWVAGVLNGTRKTPFSRIRTRSADITLDEARAKGYVKGNLKKEEFFNILQRTTTPTTVYKKQKLDRDDVLDITDFDVVIWMKGEMRLMLEEEIARAILIGDGRDVGDEDKIKDPMGSVDGAGIRSILHDHDMYVTTVTVNVDDANSNYNEIIEAVARARRFYKGTGVPTLYTTASNHTEMLLSKDGLGRRLYANDTELANALRVTEIVDVEVMETLATSVIGIIVNLADYVVGADKGGEINLFDFFDIDYNQLKYLMETRVSGALVKLKSAIVLRRAAATDVLAEPTKPTFNATTGVVTIPTVTGVTYEDGAGNTLTAGAQTALAEGASLKVVAVADSGYYVTDSAESEWTFQRPRS